MEAEAQYTRVGAAAIALAAALAQAFDALVPWREAEPQPVTASPTPTAP